MAKAIIKPVIEKNNKEISENIVNDDGNLEPIKPSKLNHLIRKVKKDYTFPFREICGECFYNGYCDKIANKCPYNNIPKIEMEEE